MRWLAEIWPFSELISSSDMLSSCLRKLPQIGAVSRCCGREKAAEALDLYTDAGDSAGIDLPRFAVHGVARLHRTPGGLRFLAAWSDFLIITRGTFHVLNELVAW